MGGHPLTCRARRVVRGRFAAALVGLGLVATGCAHRGYVDHRVPAFVAPGPARYATSTHPVTLREDDAVLLPGGIRLVRADRARRAPDFALTDDRGKVHTLESLRGRVVWIDLWAVWCATCRAEFPFVERLQERFDANGLTVLAVCRNSTREGFVSASRKDWIHFAMVDANQLDDFPMPVRAFPTSVLIDRAGRVRGYWQGHRTPEAMEQAVRYLLAEGAQSPLAPVPVAEKEAGSRKEPRMATSENVLRARMELADDVVAPGGFFEGMVTLDVDPGWFLSAEKREGAVPLRIRFGPSEAFRVLDCRLPFPSPVETSTGMQVGHFGKLELPVWGLLAQEVPTGRTVELEIVATVQACDRTQCLAPSDITLAEELWVEGERETGP